jgi:hypothetical protein
VTVPSCKDPSVAEWQKLRSVLVRPTVRRSDHKIVGAEEVRLAADDDLERFALVERVDLVVVCQPDVQLAVMEACWRSWKRNEKPSERNR